MNIRWTITQDGELKPLIGEPVKTRIANIFTTKREAKNVRDTIRRLLKLKLNYN